MSQQLPIPEPLWNTIPADARAALLSAWKAMEDRIAELEAIVRNLQARLRLNSTNSSRPPSSDPIGGTDHENRASIDREDGATRGGRVGLRLIGAYCHAARHAAECAE
jgi:transposase